MSGDDFHRGHDSLLFILSLQQYAYLFLSRPYPGKAITSKESYPELLEATI
jgi:hypothetical protein